MLQNNLDTINRHKGYRSKLKRAWIVRKNSSDYSEYLEQLKNRLIGGKLSNKTKKKISNSHRGKVLSVAHKKAISEGLTRGG
jgi:hypothetical protein